MRWHPIFDIRAADLARWRTLTPDQAMAEAAASRDGVLDHRQLRALGFSASAIGRRVDRRTLFRLHRGVYAVGRAGVSPRGAARAALLHCGRDAVLSHRTAAWMMDLLAYRARVDVTTIARTAPPPRPSRIDQHHTSAWRQGDVVWIGDFPCTSVARTLADLAGARDPHDFRSAWNVADERLMLDVHSLTAEVERRRPGMAVLRARLGAHDETPPVESVLEERFYDLCREHGIRAPRCQWPLEIEDRTGRVDFVFLPERVSVEVDGRKWHAIQEAHLRDREKDLALRAAGFDPHRYAYQQVTGNGSKVAQIVAAALTARNPRG